MRDTLYLATRPTHVQSCDQLVISTPSQAHWGTGYSTTVGNPSNRDELLRTQKLTFSGKIMSRESSIVEGTLRAPVAYLNVMAGIFTDIPPEWTLNGQSRSVIEPLVSR